MEDKKFELIVERLIERSEEGKIIWESTAETNTYLATLKDSSISVRQNFGNGTSQPNIFSGGIAPFEEPFEISRSIYIFGFRNENGDVVESVIVSESNGSLFDKAKKVFELAQIQSIENNPIVDSILAQLAA